MLSSAFLQDSLEMLWWWTPWNSGPGTTAEEALQQDLWGQHHPVLPSKVIHKPRGHIFDLISTIFFLLFLVLANFQFFSTLWQNWKSFLPFRTIICLVWTLFLNFFSPTTPFLSTWFMNAPWSFGLQIPHINLRGLQGPLKILRASTNLEKIQAPATCVALYYGRWEKSSASKGDLLGYRVLFIVW